MIISDLTAASPHNAGSGTANNIAVHSIKVLGTVTVFTVAMATPGTRRVRGFIFSRIGGKLPVHVVRRQWRV